MGWKEEFSYDFVHQFNNGRCYAGRKNFVIFDGNFVSINQIPKLSEILSFSTVVDFKYDLTEAGYSEGCRFVVVDEFGTGHSIQFDQPLHTIMDKVANGNLFFIQKIGEGEKKHMAHVAAKREK